MRRPVQVALLATFMLISLVAFNQTSGSREDSAPQYTKDGQMKLPEDYREWIYLSTGFDMSYTPAQNSSHHMFDSVFVNREAYKSFLQTGTWPDKTMLVLEVRGARSKGSINQSGNYQDTERMGLEVHVKDQSRFPDGKWAFFGFGDSKTGEMMPLSSPCNTCHAEHGAVDTTFVQFYPTLLPIARSKGTLSAGYTKESAAK
jgi:Cytochrome P460